MGYSIPDSDPIPFLELILSSMTVGFASDVQFVHPVTQYGHYFVVKWAAFLYEGFLRYRKKREMGG
jgi:hypothetical protein